MVNLSGIIPEYNSPHIATQGCRVCEELKSEVNYGKIP